MTKSRFRAVILSGILLGMIQAAALEGGVQTSDCGVSAGVWRRVAARLTEAQSLTVYATDTDPVYDDRVLAMQGRDVFMNFPVRGSVQVKNASEIRRITKTLAADVNLKGCLAMCFLPRHAVRVFLPDRKRIDLTICYECEQIWVDGAEGHAEIPIHGTSKAVLNEILHRAGIELAPAPFR